MQMYGTLLVTGLVSSLGHCLGMCGPLLLVVGLQSEARGVIALFRHLIYHSARIMVYMILGALLAGISSFLTPGARLGSWAGMLSVALGLGVVVMGLGYVGWLPALQLPRLGRLWQRAQRWALPKAKHPAGMALLGALNGLLPCGLVYGALLVVTASQQVISGALGMLAFGIGTIPALLVVGLGARAIKIGLRRRLARASGFLVGIVGLQLVVRGMASLQVVPHLWVGKVMLW